MTSTKHCALSPEEKRLKSGAGQRILWTILGVHFVSMAALATLLPETFVEMPWTLPLVEFSREWLPNIHRIASRSALPDTFEAYLAISFLFVVISLVVGILLIPSNSSYIPFTSGVQKLGMVALSACLAGLFATYYFSSFMISGGLGVLEGRSGSIFAFALSGRIGMATALNFFCNTALLLFSISFLVAIRQPVTSSKYSISQGKEQS